MKQTPFLVQLFRDGGDSDASAFPFSLPFVRHLNLTFRTPVTFFVGENGSGKSTLLEAIAVLARFPVGGGGKNELADRHAPEQASPLTAVLRAAFRVRPHNGYFFRAEFQAHFASLLDQRKDDPDFKANPYWRYGGQSLHTQSHGEAFLSVIQSFDDGLFLMDEPEAALSPQRQLALLAYIARLAETGHTQFIIATHSPILMTLPGAQIISFDDPTLPDIKLEDTTHYQITRGILNNPPQYWQHLAPELDDEPAGDAGEPGLFD